MAPESHEHHRPTPVDSPGGLDRPSEAQLHEPQVDGFQGRLASGPDVSPAPEQVAGIAVAAGEIVPGQVTSHLRSLRRR